jgi:hypothetical protein
VATQTRWRDLYRTIKFKILQIKVAYGQGTTLLMANAMTLFEIFLMI